MMEWQPHEIAYLAANWRHMTDAEIAPVLGRTRSAVASRRLRHGMHKLGTSWRESENAVIVAMWKHSSDAEMAAVIGRSATAVKRQRMNLGLLHRVVVNHQAWSEREISTLRRLHAVLSDRTLAERLGRSVGSIACKRLDLGLRRPRPHVAPWTDSQRTYVLRNYRAIGASQISAILGRSRNSVIGLYHRAAR